jgi:hypothetical protein
MSINDDFWIDDCFRVYKDRFLWKTFLKDGTGLVSALTKEDAISGTRFYLKGKQEGFPDPISSYDGTVGGKL